MKKIFISYKQSDSIFAARLIRHWIREFGYEPLMDDEVFDEGETKDLIRESIKKCDLFLVILSPNYYSSDWTNSELGQAEAHEKDIVFVSISKDVFPHKPYENKIPLQFLNISDPADWRDGLGKVLRKHDKNINAEEEGLDQFFSKYLKANMWVEERANLENFGYKQLHVSSTVELASKWVGWRRSDIKFQVEGDYEMEEEVVKNIPSEVFEPDLKNEDKVNYAVGSFLEDLTDEEVLTLNVKRIPNRLVRAVADRFELIQEQCYPKRHLFDQTNPSYPHSLIVHMVLVTSDEYLIIGHRSSRPRFYENCWAATYEEHMLPEDQDPFQTALRGLKEELVGTDKSEAHIKDVRFFSLFRELDYWSNIAKALSFWDINFGLSGVINIKLSAEEVFDNWQKRKINTPDKIEFRHIVAIPNNPENIWELLQSEKFDPSRYVSKIKAPKGLQLNFPDFNGNPLWWRWHPTTKIRLLRYLTSERYLGYTEKKVKSM